MVPFLSALDDVRDILRIKLGTEYLSLEMLQQSFHHRDSVSAVCGSVPRRQMTEILERKVPHHILLNEPWQESLWRTLAQAHLDLRTSSQIIERLDVCQTGSLHVDQFIQGAVEQRSDLSNLNLYATSLAIQHTREMRAKVSLTIFKIHAEFSRLTWKMSKLILRHPYDPFEDRFFDDYKHIQYNGSYDPFKSHSLNRDGSAANHHLGQLDPVAQDALNCVSAWNGQGALPHQRNHLSIKVGTGKIMAGGKPDQLWGNGTKFRHEIQPGDMLLVDTGPRYDGSGFKLKHREVDIVNVKVVFEKHIEISGKLTSSGGGWCRFRIVRGHHKDDGADVAGEAYHNLCISASTDDLSPRSRQAVFEWDIHTKSKSVNALDALEREHRCLLKELKKSLVESAVLDEQELFRDAFELWKMAVPGDRRLAQAAKLSRNDLPMVLELPSDDMPTIPEERALVDSRLRESRSQLQVGTFSQDVVQIGSATRFSEVDQCAVPPDKSTGVSLSMISVAENMDADETDPPEVDDAKAKCSETGPPQMPPQVLAMTARIENWDRRHRDGCQVLSCSRNPNTCGVPHLDC
eukprot:gnl/MRDRNA2_/MRDRNA2_76565_c0_seq1.p1 gnl/MRDRNA2_/MRDRNA2_76565_c0~~gnl/MRDRNA2_/MRDRNA2_76565_c0_seq1.p1  ORF type:complete len:631 (+),score=100.92 gnl/MRDRNA2_/MRDRNA2_76565_c0_seq1:166-1893(+)